MALEASTQDYIPANNFIEDEDEPKKITTESIESPGGGVAEEQGNIVEGRVGNFTHTHHISTTDTFSFAPKKKPTPIEIRRWMVESQSTVDKVVTDWQSNLIERSRPVSTTLEELARFISILDKEPSRFFSSVSSSSAQPFPLLTGKLQNNTGSFESTINIYLHVIFLAISKVNYTMGKNGLERKSRNMKLSVEERHKFLNVLNQFTLVAEDALKFLHTHEKYLAPACSGLIAMRNDLYKILRTVNAEPLGKIIPLLGSFVPLEEVRMEEDTLWMKKLCTQKAKLSSNSAAYLHLKVGSKDYSFLVRPNQSSKGEKETTPNVDRERRSVTMERLELVEILLKQLSTCVQSCSRNCKECQQELSQIGNQLWKSFYTLLANLKSDRKKERLKPENCSESLKYSLCNLEVKFHQVEKLLEEIPDHLRRIVGICDECCMQLINGIEEEFNDIFEEEWSNSPVKDIAEEYFKSRRSFLKGCFPFLWKVIVKVFLGLRGSGNSNKTGDFYNDKSLKLFWEVVKTEMEQFRKELKAKELQADYTIVVTVPVSCEERKDYSQPSSNYLHRYVQRRISKEKIGDDDG